MNAHHLSTHVTTVPRCTSGSYVSLPGLPSARQSTIHLLHRTQRWRYLCPPRQPAATHIIATSALGHPFSEKRYVYSHYLAAQPAALCRQSIRRAAQRRTKGGRRAYTGTGTMMSHKTSTHGSDYSVDVPASSPMPAPLKSVLARKCDWRCRRGSARATPGMPALTDGALLWTGVLLVLGVDTVEPASLRLPEPCRCNAPSPADWFS